MIPVERAHLYVAARSHPGMSGKSNEDLFSVTAFQVSANDPTPAVFAIVADGIGGHRAGEVASEIAVEMISQAIAESDASQPTAILQAAIIRANQAIYAQSQANAEQKGMGSTCVCAWVIGDRLYTASVGDSRIYLIRGNTIQQLTTDHTWVQEAVEHGALTPEQARGHPNANVIRRYLGAPRTVEPDLRLRLHPGESDAQAERNQGTRLRPGDCLLLCSDGLSDVVEDAEILAILQTKRGDEAVQRLIDLANERGGPDNITVVTLEVPRPTKRRKSRREREKKSWRIALTCSGISMVLIAALLVVGGLGWYFLGPVLVPPSTLTPSPTTTIPFTVTPSPTAQPTLTPTFTPPPTDTLLPTITPSETPFDSKFTPETPPPQEFTPEITASPNP